MSIKKITEELNNDINIFLGYAPEGSLKHTRNQILKDYIISSQKYLINNIVKDEIDRLSKRSNEIKELILKFELDIDDHRFDEINQSINHWENILNNLDK